MSIADLLNTELHAQRQADQSGFGGDLEEIPLSLDKNMAGELLEK